jgi:hypothetical protein
MTKVSTPHQGSAPLPGSVFAPRHVRILKISVAIMTALLLLGIVALVFGIARQASKFSTAPRPAALPAAQAPYERTLDLGQGKIEGISASSEALILHWKGDGNDLILSIDPRSGQELGRIQVPHR